MIILGKGSYVRIREFVRVMSVRVMENLLYFVIVGQDDTPLFELEFGPHAKPQAASDKVSGVERIWIMQSCLSMHKYLLIC